MQEESPRVDDLNEQSELNGHNEPDALDWSGDQHVGYEENEVEQEPQAIGIKEDG